MTKADVARLAGLSSSTNVYHLDTARIEAALAADPWIGGAEVERRLPGTVEIRITERVPVAQTLRGEVPEAVAADGVLLPEAPTDGLPEIRAALGDLSDVDRAAAATAVAAMMPSLRERVRALDHRRRRRAQDRAHRWIARRVRDGGRCAREGGSAPKRAALGGAGPRHVAHGGRVGPRRAERRSWPTAARSRVDRASARTVT